MKINGKEILDIIIRDDKGNDIIYISEEEVKNNTTSRIFIRTKYDINLNQELVTGKNNEVNK